MVVAAHRVDGLLSQRIGLRDKIGPEIRLGIVVEIFGRRIERVGERRKAGHAALRRHIRQIGVALNDVDDIENIVVAGPSRIGADAGFVDIGALEFELADDGVGMDAGQAAEQQRVGGHQRLHVGNDGVDVVGDQRLVVGIDAAQNVTGGIVEDHADLGEIGVRRVGRRGPGRERRGCRQESGGAVLRRQGCERRIVIDDIENVEMAGAERILCGSHAAERSAAIYRGAGRRQRGRDVGQDGLDMAERRARELSCGYFGLEAGLHRREIVGVAYDAAVSLSAFRDDVLPQAAHQCPRRVVEGGAKVGEGGSG